MTFVFAAAHSGVSSLDLGRSFASGLFYSVAARPMSGRPGNGCCDIPALALENSCIAKNAVEICASHAVLLRCVISAERADFVALLGRFLPRLGPSSTPGWPLFFSGPFFPKAGLLLRGRAMFEDRWHLGKQPRSQLCHAGL